MAAVPPTLNVSDRNYFRRAASTTSRDWYVTGPLRSRTTGQLFFDFSKRREDADGKFAGAISVSLLPSYFTRFFRELVADDPVFSMALVLADGTVIARYPEAADGTRLPPESPLRKAMEAGLPSGEASGRSNIDQAFRYAAFHRVADLPLYVAATARQDLLLGEWRRATSVLALITVPLALGLMGMCWFAMRRVRSQHQTSLDLEEQYTQRLLAEEALRQAQKMEALGRLTGGVAHDFNNILMVVQSNVALARKLQERGKPLTDVLAPIERAVSNGAQLTRQLLAIARRQPLQVTTVSLQQALPEVARLMDSTLGRQVRVTCEVSADAGPVTVDQAELELAIINLCLNARDAMPEGGELGIRAGMALPPDGLLPQAPWVRITVSDQGEGIPPELIERVMEPFFTTKPAGKGTGLGLSQVHSFVQQAGGRLEIRSEPGRGTTVAILLPSTDAVVSTALETAAAATPALSGQVLLVEDNDDIASSLLGLLTEAGAQVRRHATAEAALEDLAQPGARADAVLSDISLAGTLTGVDLARSLARTHPQLPIVLMTGYTERLHEAVSLGYTVLPKPAPAETLIRALEKALANRTVV